MVAKFWDKRQLTVLGEDENENDGEAEDVKLKGIDIARWEKRKGLCVVLEKDRVEVLRQDHNSQAAGHCGQHRTQEFVFRNFLCDKLQEDVAKYVGGRIRCQKAKADRHSRQTKLIPLPTGEQPFEQIVMNFAGELPKSERFNAILVVTNRFTKVQHYIPPRQHGLQLT